MSLPCAQRELLIQTHTNYGKYPYPKHPPDTTSADAPSPCQPPKQSTKESSVAVSEDRHRNSSSQDSCHLRRPRGTSPRILLHCCSPARKDSDHSPPTRQPRGQLELARMYFSSLPSNRVGVRERHNHRRNHGARYGCKTCWKRIQQCLGGFLR